MRWSEHGRGRPIGRNGSFSEFLLKAKPFLATPGGEFPPPPVMQELYLRGEIGGGMSGGLTWKPVEWIGDLAYLSILTALGEQMIDPRGSRTFNEWNAACYEKFFGLEYAKYLRLLNECDSAKAVYQQSRTEENWLNEITAAQRLADYFTEKLAP